MNHLRCALLTVSLVLLVPAGIRAAEIYRLAGVIPIGGEGGWDYLSVDPVAHRLFVSHASRVVVVDTRTDTIIGEIADTPGVHGVALAPALGRIFVSNGREDNVSIVELGTWKTTGHVATGKNPDAILYEPGRREVYVFNGRGRSVTVFTATSGVVVATVSLGGRSGLPQTLPCRGRVSRGRARPTARDGAWNQEGGGLCARCDALSGTGGRSGGESRARDGGDGWRCPAARASSPSVIR